MNKDQGVPQHRRKLHRIPMNHGLEASFLQGKQMRSFIRLCPETRNLEKEQSVNNDNRPEF